MGLIQAGFWLLLLCIAHDGWLHLLLRSTDTTLTTIERRGLSCLSVAIWACVWACWVAAVLLRVDWAAAIG